MYQLLAWNLDGYQPAKHEYLVNYLDQHLPDFVILTETKGKLERIESHISTIRGYRAVYNVHVPANYHGIVMLVKRGINVKKYKISMNIPCRRDSKSGDPTIGRIIALQVEGKFNIIGTYTPNSGGGYTDKHYYRVEQWDPCFRELVNRLNRKLPTIIAGDLNIAPTPLDVSTPKGMEGWGGYKPEEREQFQNLLDQGWVDIWRRDHPKLKSYSWIGYGKAGANGKYGMRLDHILASTSMVDSISNCKMLDGTISDHKMMSCSINI